MNLNIDWWLSLVVAVPVGIVANLVTPKVQTWLDRRSERGRIKQKEIAEKFSVRVAEYARDISLFYVYLLKIGLMVSLLGALEAISNSIFGVLPSAIGLMRGGIVQSKLFNFTALVDSCVRLVVTLLIFTLCKEALSMVNAVVAERKRLTSR